MLRIVDVNLNRIGEGLRLLEDMARFVLNDLALSEELKTIRHGVLPKDPELQNKLLGARRADKDVAAFLDVEGERERTDAVSVVRANSQRVQQSLRVLEETAKIHGPETGLDWDRFKHARFALYTIEQKMVLRLTRRQKVEKVTGLYVIIDAESLRGRKEVDIARQAIQGGAHVIQLRDKVRPRGMLVPISRELKKICAASDVLFIVNDYLDLALAADADGLHIGQEDLPVSDARGMLPQDKILGCSTATVTEAVQAEKEGADYVAVGAIYSTASKTGIRPAGLKTLRQVKKKVSVPVVAIGGINEDNVAEVIEAGADAVAVISAVLGADDVRKASQKLSRIIKKKSKH